MSSLSASVMMQWLLVAQCVLLAAFLRHRGALWPLAMLLANLALQMLADMGLNQGWWPLWDLRAFCAFAYGPLILALVRHLAWRDRPPLSWPHAIPSLVMLLLVQFMPAFIPAIGPLVSVSLALYLALAFIELARYHRVLRATRSNFDQENLRWLGEVLIGLAIIGTIDFSRVLLRPVWPDLDPWLAAATLGAALFGVYYLTWRGLQRPELFSGLSADDEVLAEVAPSPNPDQSDTQQRVRIDHLQQFMADQRPYLAPDLSVQVLASQLGWPAKQVSSVINSAFGCNFNDFINRARVAAACALLRDPARQKDKLLSIQLDAGFASKSVFNAAFKRHTGMTPSAYREQGPESRSEAS